ncbi:MAG: hypothetical protein AAF413_04045 [Patescibacteria group bacterium]
MLAALKRKSKKAKDKQVADLSAKLKGDKSPKADKKNAKAKQVKNDKPADDRLSGMEDIQAMQKAKEEAGDCMFC